MISRSLLVALLLTAPVSAATAATIQVPAGGNLQAALNAAQPGDELVLAAGARFVAEFRLPPKPAGPAITIRSSAALPNRRITPADASLLPTLAPGVIAPALDATNAANWRFDGVQFEGATTGHGDIVVLQDSTNITFDRVLIVGGSLGQKRGILGNGRAITVTRSHIANIWRTDQETQAFAAWDGAGPYTLTDNYLEAGSISVLFGGANSRSADRIPSDILVEGNHMSKRLEWKGQSRVVKNLFELKSAKRVVIRRNLFERNWTQAQAGYAILFTVRNDEGGAPWSAVEDVLFEHNVVRDTENGINVLGYDGYQPSEQATRITIRHNLVEVSSRFALLGGEIGTLTIDHNTVVGNSNMFLLLYPGDIWVSGTAKPRDAQFAVDSLTLTHNLAHHGEYGVFGDLGLGGGMEGLKNLTRTYTWSDNVLALAPADNRAPLPEGTSLPTLAVHRAEFDEYAGAYTLRAGSTYRGAGAGGVDLGRAASSAQPTPNPCTAAAPANPIANPSFAMMTSADHAATLSNGDPVVSSYQIAYFASGADPASDKPVQGPSTVAKTAWTLVSGTTDCYQTKLPLPVPDGATVIGAIKALRAATPTTPSAESPWSPVSNPFFLAPVLRAPTRVLVIP